MLMNKAVLSLALLSAAPVGVQATTTQAKTCAEQDPCLDFSIVKLEPGDPGNSACSSCTYKVCMVVNTQNDSSCNMGGVREFTHSCEKNDAVCIIENGFKNDVTYLFRNDIGVNLGNSHEQCQLIPAGGVAEFNLRGGNLYGAKCWNTVVEGTAYFERAVESGMGMVQCMDMPYKLKNGCTTADGNECSCYNALDQCMWTVHAPATCGPTTTLPTTTTTTDSQTGGGGVS